MSTWSRTRLVNPLVSNFEALMYAVLAVIVCYAVVLIILFIHSRVYKLM